MNQQWNVIMDKQIKVLIISLVLGFVFTYWSVIILGYLAAMPLPEFSQISPIVIMAIIDLVIAGIPLAILFIIFAHIITRLNSTNSATPYIMLALPFFTSQLLLGAFSVSNLAFFLTTLPKYIALVLTMIYVIKIPKVKSE